MAEKKYMIYIKLAAGIAITALLVFWVHATVGWGSIVDMAGQITLVDWLLVVAAIVFSHLLRALRLIICYRARRTNPLDTAAIGFVHNCLNFLLPMRLGELALPILSKSNLGVRFRDSTVALVFIRLLDLHVLLVLVVYFVGGTLIEGRFLWLAVACLVAVPIALLTQRIWAPKLPLFPDLQEITGTPRYWLTNYLLTTLVWLTKLGALSYLALRLSDIELNHAWVAITLADASSISPITGLANAGTFEAAFVLPLWLLGYDHATTLSVAVTLHMVLGLVSLLMGSVGFAIMFFKRLHVPVEAMVSGRSSDPAGVPETRP